MLIPDALKQKLVPSDKLNIGKAEALLDTL